MKKVGESAGALQRAEQEKKFYSAILDSWVTEKEFLSQVKENGIHFEAIQKGDFISKQKKDDGFVRTGFFGGYWLLKPEAFEDLVKSFKNNAIHNNTQIA